MVDPPALIVAGPTCSGKSALALALAERLGGAVINADSMQVYRELRILTARPSRMDEARVPHLLYGVRPAVQAGSVAWWRMAALAAMARIRADGRVPIVCGGTGLYFSALVQGLADIPDPGTEARREARRLLTELGSAALHNRLAEADPTTATQLRPSDGQRVARAYEVWRGTGRGLAAWQAQPRTQSGWRFAAILFDPPRAELRAAVAGRFTTMLEHGAAEEVRALLAEGLDPALPAMRAHGVPELAAHLRGEITLEEAQRRTELATGQYAKRQTTWFRHHALAPNERTITINARFREIAQFSEIQLAGLANFIESPS